MSGNREKNALISKARHNLKNPVNAILGFSEMLIEDCEDEGFDSIALDLKKIHDSGTEILQIIEESLSDSNVEVSGDKGLYIGASQDLQLYHNGTDSYILNATGNFRIGQYNNANLKFFDCFIDGIPVKIYFPKILVYISNVVCGVWY